MNRIGTMFDSNVVPHLVLCELISKIKKIGVLFDKMECTVVSM